MRGALIAGAIALSAWVSASAAAAPTERQVCASDACSFTLTPQQLLAAAERLVHEQRYAEAAPLIAALRLAPGYTMQTRFLTGFIAAQTGKLPEAAAQYRAILTDDPRQTAVRLELAKVMLAMRQPAAADKQFRIAEQDATLSPEVLRTIRTVRDTIRSARAWQVDVSIGIAPDSNINNATAVDTVTVMLGDTPIPLTLDDRARKRSGLGQTGQLSARLRLPVAKKLSALADFDVSGTNYSGSTFDDYVAQLALGGEYRFTDRTSASLQTVGASRWFGGDAVSRQIGVRGGAQTLIGTNRRIGFQLDARRTNALFDSGYSGWQGGLYGTYEQSLSPAIVLSAGPFLRRDWLNERAYSSTEIGANAGIGGELRFGINFGLSAGVSRARYDAPITLFDVSPRRDWRLVSRATLGNRKIRVLGLSPQVSWSFSRIDSSLTLYKTSRSRFEFTLARYF
jgi:hypothetical protein